MTNTNHNHESNTGHDHQLPDLVDSRDSDPDSLPSLIEVEDPAENAEPELEEVEDEQQQAGAPQQHQQPNLNINFNEMNR